MILLALRLWAANRLLMKGWTMYGSEHLGMLPADRTDSPLPGSTSAPRMIPNQLDHLHEAEAVKIENDLLKILSKSVRASDRRQWIFAFLGTTIALHVVERDTWRFLYWTTHLSIS